AQQTREIEQDLGAHRRCVLLEVTFQLRGRLKRRRDIEQRSGQQESSRRRAPDGRPHFSDAPKRGRSRQLQHAQRLGGLLLPALGDLETNRRRARERQIFAARVRRFLGQQSANLDKLQFFQDSIVQ